MIELRVIQCIIVRFDKRGSILAVHDIYYRDLVGIIQFQQA